MVRLGIVGMEERGMWMRSWSSGNESGLAYTLKARLAEVLRRIADVHYSKKLSALPGRTRRLFIGLGVRCSWAAIHLELRSNLRRLW